MALGKNFANTQDLVSVEKIRDNTAVLKNGRLVKILMVGGMNTALKSEEELDIVSSAYRNFLNGLEFPVQIVIHSRKVNIKRYLDSLEERKSKEPSPLLQSQISEYKEFIEGFVRDNDIMEKIFLVVVSYVTPHIPGKAATSGLGGILPFMGKKDGEKAKEKEDEKNELTEANFKESLEQLDQRVGQVAEALKAIDLESVVLNDRELVELFYNFYNPETVERESLNLPPVENS